MNSIARTASLAPYKTLSLAQAWLWCLLPCLFIGLPSSKLYAQALYPSSLRQQLQDNDQDGVINARDLCPDTPIGSAIDNAGCPITHTEYYQIDFQIHFASAKAQLQPEQYQQITQIGEFLQQHPQSLICLEGHTDDQGADWFNQRLSYQRANAIAEHLRQEYAIADDRMIRLGYGANQPLVANQDEQSRYQNRRVSGTILLPVSPTNNRWQLPFALNQYRLSAQQKNTLANIPLKAETVPSVFVLITGHTDSSGSPRLNQLLSEKRAHHVAAYLQSISSLSETQIKSKGYGDRRPALSQSESGDSAKNRRVEVQLFKQPALSKQFIEAKWTIWSVDDMATEEDSPSSITHSITP